MVLASLLVAYCLIGTLGAVVMYSACVRAGMADDSGPGVQAQDQRRRIVAYPSF